MLSLNNTYLYFFTPNEENRKLMIFYGGRFTQIKIQNQWNP